jgi:hypothetical protein
VRRHLVLGIGYRMLYSHLRETVFLELRSVLGFPRLEIDRRDASFQQVGTSGGASAKAREVLLTSSSQLATDSVAEKSEKPRVPM